MSCYRKNRQSAYLRAGQCFLLMIALLNFSGVKTTQAEAQSFLLVVSLGRSGDILYSTPVGAGAMIRLSWIHSVELTPWEEYYLVSGSGEIVLKKTRFQSYGAGVPEYGGEFRQEKGWMVHENINRDIPAINWIHSRSAKFQIDLNGTVLLKPDALPHHQPLKLSISSESP